VAPRQLEHDGNRARLPRRALPAVHRRGRTGQRELVDVHLNQTPVAATPPADLNAQTPPSWHSAAGGHAYEWHDGRLQALASVALAPGTNYVGKWSVPLLADGQRTAITGTLWHRNDPSFVWFWPIVVLLACVIAAWRAGSAELDARVARVLGVAWLLGTLAADIGRSLHGRPGVSVFQWAEFVVVAAFVCWGCGRWCSALRGSFCTS
jgi:hypothetical protein